SDQSGVGLQKSGLFEPFHHGGIRHNKLNNLHLALCMTIDIFLQPRQVDGPYPRPDGLYYERPAAAKHAGVDILSTGSVKDGILSLCRLDHRWPDELVY